MSRQDDFDAACAEFTAAMADDAAWKHTYFGATYATRISQAIDHVRAACDRMEQAIRDDRNFWHTEAEGHRSGFVAYDQPMLCRWCDVVHTGGPENCGKPEARPTEAQTLTGR